MDHPTPAALPAAEYHFHTHTHHDPESDGHQADGMFAEGQEAVVLAEVVEECSLVVRIVLVMVVDATVVHIDSERTVFGLEEVMSGLQAAHSFGIAFD